MRKTEFGRRSYLKIFLIGVLAVLFIVASLVLIREWEKSISVSHQDVSGETVDPAFEGYTLKENVETFLVLGLDKFDGEAMADSYNNDKQADFLMLFVFDNNAKNYTAIHINRDTMVDINVLGVAGNKISTVHRQIALSHTYGNGRDLSCHNTSESVSSLLMGIKVNHYASLTMDSVKIVNDLVGGVEVLVYDDFSGVDPTLVQGEKVTLMGDQALTYVRARKDLVDSSNVARMARQQQYVTALYDAFNECVEQDDSFVIDASVKLSEHMISDRSVTQLQSLADKFGEYEFLGIENIGGEYFTGAEYMEFYPDKESVKELVIRLFYTPNN